MMELETLRPQLGVSKITARPECRAQRLLAPLEYVGHPSFEDPAREAEILAPMPQAEDYESMRREMKAPREAPPELASLYETPLLSKDQEQHLFRKMNFLKYQASRLVNELREAGEPESEVESSPLFLQKLDQIEELLTQSHQIKELLINANMRLVVSITRRHLGQSDNFFELLSDGNLSLIRAVEKFDYGRNFKFCTYASWAIMMNFSRSLPHEKHRRERFMTGHEEVLELAQDFRTVEYDLLATQERATHSVNRLLQYLEPREREIIRMRAGLDDHPQAMTLEEIGRQFGITKERVRQLNARAMKKLRCIAEKQHLDLP